MPRDTYVSPRWRVPVILFTFLQNIFFISSKNYMYLGLNTYRPACLVPIQIWRIGKRKDARVKYEHTTGCVRENTTTKLVLTPAESHSLRPLWDTSRYIGRYRISIVFNDGMKIVTGFFVHEVAMQCTWKLLFREFDWPAYSCLSAIPINPVRFGAVHFWAYTINVLCTICTVYIFYTKMCSGRYVHLR